MKTQKKLFITPSLATKFFWFASLLFLALCLSFLVKHAYLNAFAAFFVAVFCFYLIKRINAIKSEDK